MRKWNTASRIGLRGMGIGVLLIIGGILIGADMDIVYDRAPIAGMLASVIWEVHDMNGGR